MKITNHSQQTKPPIKIGQSEISSKNDYSSRSGARDKTADIKITYLFKKKCQKCHKMYGTDFKNSIKCYFCSFRPDKRFK